MIEKEARQPAAVMPLKDSSQKARGYLPEPGQSAWCTCRKNCTHGRFREGDLFRQLFEEVVRRCVVAGLVDGTGAAVDGSVIEADASHERRLPGFLEPRRTVEKSVTDMPRPMVLSCERNRLLVHEQKAAALVSLKAVVACADDDSCLDRRRSASSFEGGRRDVSQECL